PLKPPIAMEIRTQNEHVILIDDADWPLVKDHVWNAAKGSQRERYVLYAVTHVKTEDGSLCKRGYPKQKTIRMHRLLLGARPGQQVDHGDGNGLNNRRNNIRIATRSQNGANRKS